MTEEITRTSTSTVPRIYSMKESGGFIKSNFVFMLNVRETRVV